jgi:superfamily II DNA helicase RecQ
MSIGRLKHLQLGVLKALLQNTDTIGKPPTGCGKSLVYGLLSELVKCIILVVVPLNVILSSNYKNFDTVLQNYPNI